VPVSRRADSVSKPAIRKYISGKAAVLRGILGGTQRSEFLREDDGCGEVPIIGIMRLL
jgi:hypothetical protein